MPGRLRDPVPGVDEKRLRARLEAAGRGPSGPYEDWTVAELRRRAAELGVVGRSTMTKAELVAALRRA